jgi:hypothetical protein
MTYREFFENLMDIARDGKNGIRDSQVVSLDDEIAPDDTMIDGFCMEIEELLNNATGEYGWGIHNGGA